MRSIGTRNRRGQSVVEYVLGISVITIALAMGFLALSDSTQDSFRNARETVQRPFP